MSLAQHPAGHAVPPPNLLFTPQSLADRFGVPVSTIYNWRSTGKGPRGFRVGKFVRYRHADVEAWEQAQLEKEQIGKEQAAHAG